MDLSKAPKHARESEIIVNALHKNWGTSWTEWYTIGEIYYTICRYSPWAKKLFTGDNYGVLKETVDEMLISSNKLGRMIEQDGRYRLDVYI